MQRERSNLLNMNKVVALVNEWDSFESSHPGAEISDFCRFQLIREEQKLSPKEKMFGGQVPPTDTALLMKMMGRIMGAFTLYLKSAMAKTKVPFPEAFFFLGALKNTGEMNKTELANECMMEYSTAVEYIGKLVKSGFLKEKESPVDKRSKVVSLTKKGETQLMECYQYLHKIAQIMFGDMSNDSIRLCAHLLSSVEIKHSKQAVEFKNRDFDEIYKMCTGK